MVSLAQSSDYGAIATLNLEAYREFADHMSPDGWSRMQANLRGVEARAQSARFFVMKSHGAIVGSVGYCSPGKGDPEIFPADWAAILLLAVSPTHRHCGIGRELVSTCIQRARDDAAQAIGLFTNELMTAAQQLYESFGFHRERPLPSKYGLRYWRYTLQLEHATSQEADKEDL
jgi:ribosomal protein S18 acetylase RimI-like enzyme